MLSSASGVIQWVSWRSVITQPGSTQLTRMPSGPSSRAIALVRPSIPAFAVL